MMMMMMMMVVADLDPAGELLVGVLAVEEEPLLLPQHVALQLQLRLPKGGHTVHNTQAQLEKGQVSLRSVRRSLD
jgi:hypothetical protein